MRNWIIAHRGEWSDCVFPNSLSSLEGAFLKGFGVETDVRDFKDELVISHDPCVNDKYENLYRVIGLDHRIAINIKSDGLLKYFEPIKSILLQSKSFVFDCSFPELIKYRNSGIPHAIRISEYERELYWEPDYIWLDSFDSDWWLEDAEVLGFIERFPTIIVSPELHNRDYSKVWDKVLNLRASGMEVLVCTDLPSKLASVAGNL